VSKCILVIEDELTIRESVEYVLRTEGFTVVTAGTLTEARPLLTRQLALIVLDVGLPDGNGFDFFRELRRTSTLPVLFLTARGDEIDRIVGLELGADDYVTKPFSPREVAARVKAILRRDQRSSETKSALIIDHQKKIAVLDGHTLALSKQELRILSVLAEHPGRVFSRAQLLDLAWDDPSSAFDRIIDSHIKAVRAAIRQVRPELEAITTVRGEGYALIELWP